MACGTAMRRRAPDRPSDAAFTPIASSNQLHLLRKCLRIEPASFVSVTRKHLRFGQVIARSLRR